MIGGAWILGDNLGILNLMGSETINGERNYFIGALQAAARGDLAGVHRELFGASGEDGFFLQLAIHVNPRAAIAFRTAWDILQRNSQDGAQRIRDYLGITEDEAPSPLPAPQGPPPSNSSGSRRAIWVPPVNYGGQQQIWVAPIYYPQLQGERGSWVYR